MGHIAGIICISSVRKDGDEERKEDISLMMEEMVIA